MNVRRALTIASIGVLGLGAQSVPTRADGPPGHRPDPYVYTPYDPGPGYFDFRWSGFYVGAHLGGGHTSFEATETLVLSATPPIFDTLTYGQDAASVVGGVQAGWQRQWEKFVAGIEATYTLLQFDETTQSPVLTGVTRSAEVHDLFTLTGRLGYADGRWLAYAKGGWASAEVDIAFRDGTGTLIASSGGRESGWTAGVGIDYALTQNLFLGVEYNYLHFRADVAPAPTADTRFGNADVDIQTLVVRLNYRLGPAR